MSEWITINKFFLTFLNVKGSFFQVEIFDNIYIFDVFAAFEFGVLLTLLQRA